MHQKGRTKTTWIFVIMAVAVILGTGLYVAFSRQMTPTRSPATSSSSSPTITTTAPTSNPEPTGSTEVAPPISQYSEPAIVVGHSSSEASIKGILVHDQSNPHALNDDFVITEDTHISIELYYVADTEAASETVLSQDFANIDALPFLFEITGNGDEIFTERHGLGYYLHAEVFAHPGSDAVVGDLVSEIMTSIASSDTNVEIKVFGIEPCDAPNAGGFCTTRE